MTRAAEVWPADGSKPVARIAGDRDLAILARGLSKHYRNPWTLKITRGLEPLDLDLARGQVLGLLGMNGAGKTTTLKLLTGLLKPSQGNAWLFGVPIDDPRCRRPLGFLPEQPYFYDYLTGVEYLELAAGLSGLSGIEAHRGARHWLDRVGLGNRPRLVLRKYSKGMLQRLGLAAALVHGPEILILDEPMSGLDPYGRRDVRELILEQNQRGVTILFSSHILPDVEMVADRVAILHQGRLMRTASVRELTGDASSRVIVRCQGAPRDDVPAAWRDRIARKDGSGHTEFEMHGDLDVNPFLDWLMRSGAKVESVNRQGATLEELFLSATEGGAQAAEGSATATERERRAA